MEQQAMETVDQMKQAIEKKNQEIMQLQEQVKSYESGERNTAQSIQGELLKMKLQHQQKLQEMAFQKELDGNADAAKAAMDLERTIRGNKTSRKFGMWCAFWNLGNEASF